MTKIIDIKNDYIKMILQSWTYERLTDEEKKFILSILIRIKLDGRMSRRTAFEFLNNEAYKPFLDSLGYNWENWRETEGV
ncbi:MAG: hypothetical protein FWC41_08525 [Firmicutes bacterium]|nr:hypothetical protein [Bacillota bacterium]